MKPDAWMPVYIGDLLADTMHLTYAQFGAYCLLLFAYWRLAAPLADDDAMLAAITRTSPVEWRKLRPILSPFFKIEDGMWRQKRCDEELAAASRRQARASAGGNARAGNKQRLSTAQAPPQAGREQVLNECSNGAPQSSPSPIDDDDEARTRDAKREVLEAIGVWDDPRWLGNGALVDAWMNSGADLDRDILPTIKRVMANRGAQGPPSSLKYFDRAVMDAHATRTTPARPGKPNGHQTLRRNRSDVVNEAVAAAFADVAGGTPAD